MSSVVGHALAGVITASVVAGEVASKERRRFYILMALTSVLADLDVIVFLLFSPAAMTPHRGASHSLLAAALVALLLTFSCSRWLSISKERLFSCFFAAYSSHLVLDYLMGRGPQVHFFWPFDNRGYLSPVQLVPTAYYGLSLDALREVLSSAATYAGIVLELVIFVPLLYLLRAKGVLLRLAWLALSVVGVVATAVLYN